MSKLAEADLNTLARQFSTQIESLALGQFLIKEGEGVKTDPHMYVVKTGLAIAHRTLGKQSIQLGELVPGETVGEIVTLGLADRRTASVTVASEVATFICLSPADISDLESSDPRHPLLQVMRISALDRVKNFNSKEWHKYGMNPWRKGRTARLDSFISFITPPKR